METYLWKTLIFVNLQTDYLFLFKKSELKCSQISTFAQKIPFDEKTKFHVNHLLTLHICEPKFKLSVSKEVLHKSLLSLTSPVLIQEIFCLLIFADFKKFPFHEHLFSQIRREHLLRVRWFSLTKQKHSSGAHVTSWK